MSESAPAVSPPPSPLEIGGMAVIATLASWLRLRDLAHLSFNRDAGLMLSMADRLRAGERILLGIPSSKGIVNPPLSIYLVAAIQTVAHSPASITAAMAGMQILAVIGTWWIARRRFSPAVGLAAAALYATSAWAVLYARILWPPCFAPLLSVGMLAALFAWCVDGKPWGLAAAVACAAAAAQLHLTGFAWFGVIGLLWVLVRPPITRSAAIAAVVAAALLFAPFALGLATHGIAAGTKRRAFFIDNDGAAARFFLLSATHHGIDYHFPTVDADLPRLVSSATTAAFAVVPILAALLAVAGIVLVLPRRGAIVRDRFFGIPSLRIEGDPAGLVLLLFAAVPVGAMVVTGLSVSPHYVILQFPAVWIFAAIAADRLAARSTRARVIAAGAVAAIVATESTYTLALQQFIATRPLWNWSAGYSTALADQEAAIDWIVADAAGAPIRLLATPEDSGAQVPFNLQLLLDERRPGPPPAALQPVRYLIVDESNGGLSPDAVAKLSAHGAAHKGAFWVCRWP